MKFDEIGLATLLQECAERVKKYDYGIWNAVLNELDNGNRDWCKDRVGHSGEEMAVKEIRRLYAIEATLKLRDNYESN